MPVEALTVFCGASSGSNPSFLAAAREVGVAFAKNNVELIYGGGRLGLMGAVAEACLSTKGGRIHGVIPEAVRTVPHARWIYRELVN